MGSESSDQQTRMLFEKLSSGDRIALSRAITLAESQNPAHIGEANALLDMCMSSGASALRIAISGAPGVGKSSLIEALSAYVLNAGHTLAVLAIDPSSKVTGGSILGDKTRMQSLANHPKAYVRPSPAGQHYGGVAERTREAVVLCEAAGYDVVIVETVGVGQSETQVRTMVDLFALLITPGGGDEVQGIKRGILELADLVVINKADGDLKKSAMTTLAQYTQALRVLHAQGTMPAVMTCSASEGSGVEDIWKELQRKFETLQSGGQLSALRTAQHLNWFEHLVQQDLLNRIMGHPAVAAAFEEYQMKITTQKMSIRSALAGMQDVFLSILKSE